MKAFSLRYFLRKAEGKNAELFRLYARLTVNGNRLDFTINRKLKLCDWDETRGCIKGRSAACKELEKYLSTIEEKFYAIERDLMEKSIRVTADSLLKSFNEAVSGKLKETRKTLSEIFDLHNKQIAEAPFFWV